MAIDDGCVLEIPFEGGKWVEHCEASKIIDELMSEIILLTEENEKLKAARPSEEK